MKSNYMQAHMLLNANQLRSITHNILNGGMLKLMYYAA